MAFYKSVPTVVSEFLADFKEITGQDLSPSDLSREEIIKMMTYAGPISHISADLERAWDDFFPGSSSEQALIEHLKARQLPDRAQPQPSVGVIQLDGPVGGTPIPAGTQIKRLSTGDLYFTLQDAALDSSGSPQVLVNAQSINSGQAYNIDHTGEAFQLVSPISGVNSNCTSTTTFLGGRDLETPEEMLARIVAHDRNDDTGGNLQAYENMARAASPDVVTATAIKNPRGAGTVNTVITSGTTDIAGAVNAGLPVTRLPSASLISTVQAYITANNPTTDDHQTVAPTESSFDLTVKYSLFDETLRGKVDSAINKLAQIFIYSAKAGQTIYPTDLERQIDLQLGFLIKSRRVLDLDPGVSASFTVPQAEILKPGTITLVAG